MTKKPMKVLNAIVRVPSPEPHGLRMFRLGWDTYKGLRASGGNPEGREFPSHKTYPSWLAGWKIAEAGEREERARAEREAETSK